MAPTKFNLLLILLAIVDIRPMLAQFQFNGFNLGNLDNLGNFDLGTLGRFNTLGNTGGTSTTGTEAREDDFGINRAVDNILHRVGLTEEFGPRLTGLINGVAAKYFAPNPNSPIPPHVQRRVMRYCARNPRDPQCRAHPEFNVNGQPVPDAPNVGNSLLDLDTMFPNLISVKLPPIPTFSVQNLLAGVPPVLRQYLPPETVGQINGIVRQTIETLCGSINCQEQKSEWLNQRATIAEQEDLIGKTVQPNKPVSQIDRDVEIRLARTFQVKQALIRKAGLTGRVVPANNGVYQHDLLLTEPQANALIAEINQHKDSDSDPESSPFTDPALSGFFLSDNSSLVDNLTLSGDSSTYNLTMPDNSSVSDNLTLSDNSSVTENLTFVDNSTVADPPPSPSVDDNSTVGVGVVSSSARGRRKRAGNALFFENGPIMKWPLGQPIPYMFDQSVPDTDRASVRAAVREIQAQSCLTFQEVRTRPYAYYLYYVKYVNPQFCGLSYVGRAYPVNPIYLSFQCGNSMGIAIHETLHALGLQHEQQRVDRDTFININWANVNPQNYDIFARSDLVKYTSYGVPYDYGSIMHYASTIGAKADGLTTMNAKSNQYYNNAMMGQRRGLSASDIEGLRRMYCMPKCLDRNVYCGVWANIKLCTLPSIRSWMAQNCRKSCSLCGGG